MKKLIFAIVILLGILGAKPYKVTSLDGEEAALRIDRNFDEAQVMNIVDTVPTIDQVKKGTEVIYKSGSTVTVYLNPGGGSLYYVSYTVAP